MMTTRKPEFGSPVLTLTPLYHFSSDSDELQIDRGIRALRFDGSTDIPVDALTSRYLEFERPSYLLLHEPLLCGEIIPTKFLDLASPEKWEELVQRLITATSGVFQALHLFKPGRLRAGETFILLRDTRGQSQTWSTVGSGRASQMTIDFSILSVQTTSYTLNSPEMPFLSEFYRHIVLPIQDLSRFPAAELAMQLYSADDGERLDAIGIVTALEALLAKKDEREGLTYRISMRIANLLGRDANDRKRIFAEVKNFYNLRSNLVHGSQLNPKLLGQLSQQAALRETLRRVLLSVISLFAEGTSPNDLADLIDELAFDEQKRRQVQESAANLLFLGT